MRTVTIEKNIYKLEELDGKAREKALQWLYDGAIDREWWDGVYDDAETIGLKITGFDTGRSNDITGKITVSGEECANRIIANHGDKCDTYAMAKEYLANASKAQEDIESLDEEFEKALLEEYLVMLRHEYEYLTSEESLVEMAEANDYEFDGKGNIA